MMLCRHDDLLESRVMECLDQRLCVKIILQCKNLIWRTVTIIFAPFNVIESIWAKMNKTSKLFFLITILFRCRSHAPGFWNSCAVFCQITIIDIIFGRRNRSNRRNTCKYAHCHNCGKCDLIQFHCFSPFLLSDSQSE